MNLSAVYKKGFHTPSFQNIPCVLTLFLSPQHFLSEASVLEPQRPRLGRGGKIDFVAEATMEKQLPSFFVQRGLTHTPIPTSARMLPFPVF